MCVVAGEYEGQESTIPSSAISGGSVAAERLYRTPRTLAPFYNRPDSLVLMPLVSSQIPPREEVSEVLSFREPE